MQGTGISPPGYWWIRFTDVIHIFYGILYS